MDFWTVVRFLHILGAVVWVGGQLTVTVVLLPVVHGMLTAPDRADLLRGVGKRFAVVTAAVFLPLQVTTGVLLAARYGVTWASLLQPGYGRILTAKVLLFAAVMVATTVHGFAQARHEPAAARAASIAALTGSVGILLLAAALADGN
ncbi:hypothetical protein [Mycolicibacterium celeriflavum]|uniref:hypothetical protein n=1 Tax=Mycolicibacterium celeriflavum TaxID=1249101 RepID=UPI000ADACF6F|nr:hypothetical protein [Mycolicibacterium celeriflavum]